MRRTVKHIFKTRSVVTDIAEPEKLFGNHWLPYAQAEKIVFNEGTMLIQSFSHFLFFLELTKIELYSDLEAGFYNEKTRLFLFMMLKGNVSFFTKEGQPIIVAETDTCYATYNRNGEFKYKLLKGSHEFLYICPRTAWMGRNEEYYPRIGQFIHNMKTDRKLFGHMSTCTMNKDLQGSIKQFFSLKNSGQLDFEFSILRIVKSIINHYQSLLETKFSQRAYVIKDYLEEHFAELIDNKILSAHFFTTEKTLIKSFRKEFGITPYNYLISIRMERAKNLLQYEKLSPIQVYSKVGYSDFQSFRKQFKNYFGMPPSSYH